MKNHIKKLTLAGILIALGVVLSPFNIPIGSVKCFPVQHFINVLAAVILGKYYGVGMAFVISAIRLSFGVGTLMAFPGSMIGALCAGLAFSILPKISAAFIGEIIGTGILGAMSAYPIAAFILGKESAIFAFVIPFSVSTILGALFGMLVLISISKTPVWNYVRNLNTQLNAK